MEGARSDKIYRARLKQFGIGDDVVAKIDAEVRQVVDAATEACKAAPMPPADIHTDVYARSWACGTDLSRRGRARHRQEMARDPDVIFFGEDVAKAAACSRRRSACTSSSGRGGCATRRSPSRRSWAPPWGGDDRLEADRRDHVLRFLRVLRLHRHEFPRALCQRPAQVPAVVRTGNGAGSRFGAQHSQSIETGDDDPGLKWWRLDPRDVIA